MKFLTSFILLAFMFSVSNAFGLSYKREFRDKKLLTQKLIEFQEIDNAVLADVDRLQTAVTTSASVITTVTTFLAQPDVTRNITVTPGGTTADVAAGNVVVTGTNYNDKVITESLAFLANASTATAGLSAFKTVTSVVFPVQDGAAATFTIGVGDVLGLKRCMDSDHFIQATFDDVFEATRATVVFDADEVEKNTVDINGTLNGAKDIDLMFIQNFAASCF